MPAIAMPSMPALTSMLENRFALDCHRAPIPEEEPLPGEEPSPDEEEPPPHPDPTLIQLAGLAKQVSVISRTSLCATLIQHPQVSVRL